MRTVFVFAFMVCIFAAAGQKAPPLSSKLSSKKYAVSGTVTQTRAYCGGARPPDEVFVMLATPRPYPGKKFYVIQGTVNSDQRKVMLSFTSDSLGNFRFRLPPGRYSIIMEEQAKALNPSDYKTEFITADEECMKEWWAKPYYSLEVKKVPVKQLQFEFRKRCFIPLDIPCLQYIGPAPQ